MKFSILKEFGDARTGLIKTKYSEIKTPAFMPVGTLGTVKGISKELLFDMNYNIILDLCNYEHGYKDEHDYEYEYEHQ